MLSNEREARSAFWSRRLSRMRLLVSKIYAVIHCDTSTVVSRDLLRLRVWCSSAFRRFTTASPSSSCRRRPGAISAMGTGLRRC